MSIQPLAFHFCGVYFQSLCKKPKLKKKLVKRAYAAGKNDSMRGSQESLFSTGDGSESTATEVSTEQSVMSSETSGVGTDPDLTGDKTDSIEADKKTVIKNEESSQEVEDIDEAVTASSKKRDLSTNEIVAQMAKKQKESHKTNLSKAKIFVIILLITNIPLALYFSLIHQRGTVLVMKYIHDESTKRNIDVMFLMPCHSTPYFR